MRQDRPTSEIKSQSNKLHIEIEKSQIERSNLEQEKTLKPNPRIQHKPMKEKIPQKEMVLLQEKDVGTVAQLATSNVTAQSLRRNSSGNCSQSCNKESL